MILILIGLLAAMLWPAAGNHPRLMRTVQGESFGVQRVYVDGNRFVRCRFDGTELVITGKAGFVIQQCSFSEPPKLTVDGPAAMTFRALRELYKDPAFRPIVEATFEVLKTGQFKTVSAPSKALER